MIGKAHIESTARRFSSERSPNGDMTMTNADKDLCAVPANSEASSDEHQVTSFRPFAYLPIALYGAVMGLSGLSIAWNLAAEKFGAPPQISEALAVAALLAFFSISVSYLLKIVFSPDAVHDEFIHPVTGNLFGTMLISLLLLPLVIAPHWLLPAQVLWGIGASGMLVFAWFIIDTWMGNRQDTARVTPTWIIPVVGVLDIPLAVPSLDLPPIGGLTVACVAIGLFFAVPLFTIIFSRLLFEEKLPDSLQPTLLILVAPFAVGFSAYVATTGQIDMFAEALYAIMIFILTALLGRMRLLLKTCPFRVSWWAVSFPLAASASAAIRYAIASPNFVTTAIALTLLLTASIIIAGLSVKTLMSIARGDLKKISS